tara:strand:+ start:6234 stop:6986 length:753 start_codon:yes stop_codon:yes gene_type:complete
MKKLSSLLLLVIIPILSVKGFQTTEPDSGLDVLSWMYEEYEGKWYKNLTFTQETIFYGKNEEIVRTQTWYEAMSLPGKLAIKFDTKDSENGILFNNGVQYGYANGEKIQEVRRVHDLLLLGFDIYHQPIDSSANQLLRNGYDLEKMYIDEWRGREVYVIGVEKADSTKPQFWIDAERLIFVRNITIGRGNTIQEVQFNSYEKLGESWVAPEVIFKANGMLGLVEKYSEMRIPDSLNPDIFDPEKFLEVEW